MKLEISLVVVAWVALGMTVELAAKEPPRTYVVVNEAVGCQYFLTTSATGLMM